MGTTNMALSKKSKKGCTQIASAKTETIADGSGKPVEKAEKNTGKELKANQTKPNQLTADGPPIARLVKISAGLMMYRVRNDLLEIFLCHPGGPYFVNKEYGCWTLPKGESDEGEDLFVCAKREFLEETGIEPAKKKYLSLGAVRERSGKITHIWAFKKNFSGKIVSNNFHLVWPPNGTEEVEFPEIDDGKYFNVFEARVRMFPSQVYFIDQLMKFLRRDYSVERKKLEINVPISNSKNAQKANAGR